MLRDPSAIPQMLYNVSPRSQTSSNDHLHRVNSPQDQSKPGNSTEEGSSLLILVLNNVTPIEGELVHDDQVCNAGNSIPSPFRSLLNGEGSEETSQDHDNVGNDSHEDVGATKTSEKAEIEEQKWGGKAPVDVAGPVDFAVDGLVDVGEVLLRLGDDDLVVGNAVMDGHGEVGDHSEGGDESR